MVSIIIVTHNSLPFIEKALTSLVAQSYQDYELIIVDNASSDNTKKILTKYFTRLHLIENRENKGVCHARNQAISISRGEYILTLDPDVELDKNFLKNILSAAYVSPSNVGMWGGRILNYKDKKIIDTTGLILTKKYRFFDRGQGKIDNGGYDSGAKILGPCACAGLYRREMLEDIKEDYGYFDPAFFYLIEDFDLCLRAHKKGWEAYYVPTALAYHYRHGTGLPKKYIQYLSFRNRYYLIIKNKKYKDYRWCFLTFFSYDLPRLLYLLSSNPMAFKALYEVYKYWKDGQYQRKDSH